MSGDFIMLQSATTAPDAASGAAETRSGGVADVSLEADMAVAIDVKSAKIVSVSAAARAALGIGREQLMPIAIDSAMPALRRLKAISARGSLTPQTEMLSLWGVNGRMLSKSWQVTVATSAAAVVVLRASGERAPIEARHADERVTVQRSDAETLREIARRIREGQFESRRKADRLEAAGDVRPRPTALSRAESVAAISAALAPDALARLAHELKTPLTAIAAAAEIMRDERLGAMGNARYLDYARDVHESATHALAVVARLLARGDADSDRVEAIDLNDVVDRTLATLQPMAAERAITLAFLGDEGQPVVTGSATALRQILINLLSNALKFTPADGDVRAVTGYLPNGDVFLAVRDTGNGIDDSIVRRAFEGTNEPIAARAGGGFGIGLPLVIRLVAEMGAEIEFDSAPGKGTVALISFARRQVS